MTIKIVAGLVAIVFALLLFRALIRRTSKKKVREGTSDSKRRSSEKSRPSSRSRSRSKSGRRATSDYELMGGDGKSGHAGYWARQVWASLGKSRQVGGDVKSPPTNRILV